MKTSYLISSIILVVVSLVGSTWAQHEAKLGDNAALRYWSAFAQMQDSAITDDQAKELALILDGTAPYDDSRYKTLVEKNRLALETMARGASLTNCDWGIEYQLGPDTPVDYVRKALTLGRLNVLLVFHLAINGNKEGAVRALASGLHFSHDVANDGTLFATLAAKNLLVLHLRAASDLVHIGAISPSQKSVLQNAIAKLGSEGLDWRSAMKRELEIPLGLDTKASAALAQIIPVYASALSDESKIPKLEQMRASAPAPLPDIIPNPKRVREEKQDLQDRLRQTRSLLQ